jgi:hypothetical protein
MQSLSSPCPHESSLRAGFWIIQIKIQKESCKVASDNNEIIKEEFHGFPLTFIVLFPFTSSS